MKIKEFKELKETIENQDFKQNYKTINIIMLVLSVLGNITSVFLAYFLVDKVFDGINENYPIFNSICTIILLSSLELLKRDFFKKLSSQYLKTKDLISKNAAPLALISLMIVSLSFYSSIRGARIFSSKSTAIENKKNDESKQFADSIQKIYDSKISVVDNQIQDKNKRMNSKDDEETQLQSQDVLTWQQRTRIQDLKNEKVELKTEISSLDSDRVHLKSEEKSIVDDNQTQLNVNASKKEEDNSSNSFIFVIISSIVELTILAGVYFNKYYQYRIYSEYKVILEKNSGYQKWELADSILNIIYTDDLKIGDKLLSSKTLLDNCRINEVFLSPKEFNDFLKIFSSIGIFKPSGSIRHVKKTKEQAIELLKKHYKVE